MAINLNHFSRLKGDLFENIKRQKDAPHLYILWSLHPDSAPWSELRAFVVPNWDDFLPQDVSRHAVEFTNV